MLSSEIDRLMYSTFAVQSGKGARQQRLALAFPYVLLWSIEGAIHLEKCKGRDDPPMFSCGKGPAKSFKRDSSHAGTGRNSQ